VSHCACGTLFTDWIEVGDQWTLDGDLGDFMGDFIGGFGNADVPIWEGGDGVGTLSLPELPGALWGLFLNRFLFIAVSCSSCHLVPFLGFASCLLRLL